MRFLGVYCAVVLTWIALSVIGALGIHTMYCSLMGLRRSLFILPIVYYFIYDMSASLFYVHILFLMDVLIFR